MNHVPEPHKDDAIVEVAVANGVKRTLLCDRDIHPIREQVQAIVDGHSEAPLEWVTLRNVEVVLPVYQLLRSLVSQRISVIMAGGTVPLTLETGINRMRWKLICLVTQALYGERKFRAAQLLRMPVKALRKMAKLAGLKGRSKLRKRELVYALVEAGM